MGASSINKLPVALVLKCLCEPIKEADTVTDLSLHNFMPSLDVPPLFSPLNTIWCAGHRLVSGDRHRLVQRGREAQRCQLQTLFGVARPDITTGVQVSVS